MVREREDALTIIGELARREEKIKVLKKALDFIRGHEETFKAVKEMIENLEKESKHLKGRINLYRIGKPIITKTAIDKAFRKISKKKGGK